MLVRQLQTLSYIQLLFPSLLHNASILNFFLALPSCYLWVPVIGGTPSSLNHLLANRSPSTKYPGLTCLAQEWFLGRVVLKLCHGVKVRSNEIYTLQSATSMNFSLLNALLKHCADVHTSAEFFPLLTMAQIRQKHPTSSAGRETDWLDCQWLNAKLQWVFDRPELFLLLC